MMQVFKEWMREWLDRQEEDSESLREQMLEAFAEAERRHKEVLIGRILEAEEEGDL